MSEKGGDRTIEKDRYHMKSVQLISSPDYFNDKVGLLGRYCWEYYHFSCQIPHLTAAEKRPVQSDHTTIHSWHGCKIQTLTHGLLNQTLCYPKYTPNSQLTHGMDMTPADCTLKMKSQYVFVSKHIVGIFRAYMCYCTKKVNIHTNLIYYALEWCSLLTYYSERVNNIKEKS